ncbi:MAG TPA: hypothetical protein VEI97_00570 [bacterium]|nr:hypothetical protein [bacterium]
MRSNGQGRRIDDEQISRVKAAVQDEHDGIFDEQLVQLRPGDALKPWVARCRLWTLGHAPHEGR